MSKRHFTRVPGGDFKCVSCRQEFSTREELGNHYSPRGKCKRPAVMGLHLDAATSHYRWTANKPQSMAIQPPKAA